MKKILAVFVMMYLSLLGCRGEPYKYRDLGEPSEKWIGKTVKIEFGDFGETYAHKAFIVKIKELKTVNTMKFEVKYFVTEEPFVNAPTPVSAIYFHWFELGDKNGIISYKEAIPIKD
jgi:hypothetical protein